MELRRAQRGVAAIVKSSRSIRSRRLFNPPRYATTLKTCCNEDAYLKKHIQWNSRFCCLCVCSSWYVQEGLCGRGCGPTTGKDIQLIILPVYKLWRLDNLNGSNVSPFFTGSSPKLKIHSELPASLIHIHHCTWMLKTLPPDGDTLGMLR